MRLFVLLCLTLPLYAQARVVFLVPGFFSLPDHGPLPRPFSKAITETLSERSLQPIVVTGLDPVGSFQANGARLLTILQAFERAHPGEEYDVIAHSAGGLYMAQALTLEPRLRVGTVITIATPYHGAEIVDLLRWIPGFSVLTHALNLENLKEFEASGMPAILARIVWRKNVRWMAIGAAQAPCEGPVSCGRAENQSWLLSLAWRFAGVEGDGVVSVDSARARDLGFTPWDFVVPLEHWEVVLDADWFRALGVSNPGWIERRQRATFAAVAERLASAPATPHN